MYHKNLSPEEFTLLKQTSPFFFDLRSGDNEVFQSQPLKEAIQELLTQEYPLGEVDLTRTELSILLKSACNAALKDKRVTHKVLSILQPESWSQE